MASRHEVLRSTEYHLRKARSRRRCRSPAASTSTRSRRSTSAPTNSPTGRSARAPRNGGRRRARPPTTACPYRRSATLVDGGFSDAIFAPARFADPRILALADKITVTDDPAFTRAFPIKFPCYVEIVLRDGTTRGAGLDVPHGHHDDPLTDAEVEEKFTALAGRKLASARLAHVWDTIRNFDRHDRIDGLFDALTVENGR